MADVLAILRDAYLHKRPIQVDKEADEIVLGTFRYPRNTKTSYAERKGKELGDFYTVCNVLFVWSRSHIY